MSEKICVTIPEETTGLTGKVGGGPRGPRGEDGVGINVIGTATTYDDLPKTLPEGVSGGYVVEATGLYYPWLGSSFATEGIDIRGPQGEGFQETGGSAITGEWLREIVQSFAASSTERDEKGRVSAQEGTYRDGSAGTMTLTRGAGGAVTKIEYSHAASDQTFTESIVRDGAGRYASTKTAIS